MLSNIEVFEEGVYIGIACNTGKPWADYFLVGDKAEKIKNALLYVITDCEPIIGDKHTMRQYKPRGKRKGKNK